MDPSPTTTAVLPLDGDPQALVAELRRLAQVWPDDVDGRLVVAASRPTDRERALLAAVADLVALLELDADRTFGDLAVAAVRALGGPVVVAGPGLTADDLRAAAAAQAPAWSSRWSLLAPEQVAAPVLTAAVDAPALGALAEQVLAPPVPPLSARRLLSASLIVKDEQRRLPTCLASLRGRVDEVVVCDTGSSDRTVEVAEAFGATVVHAPWTDDFAAARNVPLAACTGHWVLSIDADERLVAPSRRALREALTPRGPAALGVLITSATDAHGDSGFAHEAVRLFRRRGVSWVGAVHESVVRTSDGQPPEAVRFRGVSLLHDGYLDSVHLERGKAERNLVLAQKDYDLAVAGRSPRSLAKAAYELSRALSLQPGTADRQEQLLREALDAMPADLGRLASSVASRLAALLRAAGRVAEALEPARQAVRLTPADPAAVIELAACLGAQGLAQEALDAVDRWRAGSGPGRDEVVVHNAAVADAALPEVRGVLLLELQRDAEAWEQLRSIALAHPQLFDSWRPLVEAARRTAGDGWAAAVATLCPAEPHLMLDRCGGLPAPLLAQLHAALRAAGVEPDEHSAQARAARDVALILEAQSEDDVAAAAELLEQDDPALALQAWLQLPWSSARQVAAARCLLALDEVPAALDAVDGIDPAELGAADRLTVAWLACHAGDREAATALLLSLPDEPGPLDEQVAALRSVLDLPAQRRPLPDRVVNAL